MKDSLTLRALATLATFGMVGLLLGPTACAGSGCIAACEKLAGADCNQDGAPDGDKSQCSAQCSQQDAADKTTGCGSQSKTFSSCMTSASDVCGACGSEAATYIECVADFCVQNPADPFCAAA